MPDPSLGEPTISFTYTPTGQRLSMTDASGTANYSSYDNRDRVLTKATPEGTLSYTYDAHGNVLTIASSNANGASMFLKVIWPCRPLLFPRIAAPPLGVGDH